MARPSFSTALPVLLPMLDLMKLARQMQGISEHLAKEADAARDRVDRAVGLLLSAQTRQAELVALQTTWRERLSFTAAQPMEALDRCVALPGAPEAHTVLATDGSQISPSHHEIAYCYLINIGRIILHYGQSRYPLLDNLPEVVYRSEDLYVSRQWGIRTEEWMSHQRTVSEAVALAELGEWVSGQTKASTTAQLSLALDTPAADDPRRAHTPNAPLPPTLAMVDGSLIYWFLEPLPQDACDRILPPILDAWNRLRAVKIPLVGYISASRSGEALNFLRLQSCPFEQPDCLTHCAGQTDRAPCQVVDPLRDVALWSARLSPGQRSPLWRSSAPILGQYGDHTIYFCYVHVGTEIARVEMPAWVAMDETLLAQALSLTLAQVHKGYGYPIALAEAHNQAVVRGSDRARFFALLEHQMIRAGLKNVGTSYKEAHKRGTLA